MEKEKIKAHVKEIRRTTEVIRDAVAAESAPAVQIARIATAVDRLTKSIERFEGFIEEQ